MTKNGRPMLADVVRYANSRINQAATARLRKVGDDDVGTVPVKIRNERDLLNAKCFKGGGLGYLHGGDALGQLWLVGKLDIQGMDETKLLDVGRSWWSGREEVLKDVAARTANHERESRSSSGSAKATKGERAYYKYESFLRDASDYEAGMLADLMEPTLDGGVQDWVSRIVQTEVLRVFRLPVALLACHEDYAKLDAAMRALMAMGAHGAQKNAA
jgi:hypothetical protein